MEMKSRLLRVVEQLPENSLDEVNMFLEFLLYKKAAQETALAKLSPNTELPIFQLLKNLSFYSFLNNEEAAILNSQIFDLGLNNEVVEEHTLKCPKNSPTALLQENDIIDSVYIVFVKRGYIRVWSIIKNSIDGECPKTAYLSTNQEVREEYEQIYGELEAFSPSAEQRRSLATIELCAKAETAEASYFKLSHTTFRKLLGVQAFSEWVIKCLSNKIIERHHALLHQALHQGEKVIHQIILDATINYKDNFKIIEFENSSRIAQRADVDRGTVKERIKKFPELMKTKSFSVLRNRKINRYSIICYNFLTHIEQEKHPYLTEQFRSKYCGDCNDAQCPRHTLRENSHKKRY